MNAQALRYKTLMETSTDSIYVINEKGDLQEANAAFLRRRGYTAAEVKGLNVADWDAQWSGEQLQERMRLLVGSSAVFETRHRSKDGSVFDVEVCATSVRIGGEQLFFCVTRDITGRKQAEQALRESEERFRELAENIDDIFWLSDLQHKKLLYISPAYERIWGRTCESLYASIRSWTEAVHPEDRERILALRGDDHLHEMPDMTYRIVRPDGSLRWIHQREFPVKDAKGEVVRIAGIAEDITERKRVEALLHAKEQEFRAIVENAPDQIIRYDREFRRTYVNPAVAKAYGLPAEALTGKPVGSVIQDAALDVKDDDLSEVLQQIKAVFETGQSCEYEMNWPLPTGRSYYNVRLFPELDLNGSVINVLGIARDITRRRIAEEELKKEKETLAKVFDNIPVMVGFVGADGVKRVNPEWERTMGWTLKELQEQNVDIFVEAYPDLSYRQEVLDFVAAATGDMADLKIRVRDGRVIDAACAVVHLSDGTKVAIAQDITERKQAQDRLRRSEEKFKTLFGIAPVGISVLDRQHNIVDANPALEQITRLSKVELLNGAYRRRTYLNADGTPKRANEFPSQRAITENRAINDVETGIVMENGETIWTQVSAAPLALPDASAVVITQDVTERKQAEEALREAEQKYRDIFENAGEGIFQSTPDGRYIAANPALARMYGFSSPEELIRSLQDISRQVYVDPTHREEFKRQIEEHGAVRGFEHEVFRQDGNRLWISVNARVVRDEQGAIQYYEGTVQDITERKGAAKELEEANHQLRLLSRRLFDAHEEERSHLARELHDEIGQALTAAKINLQSVTGHGGDANIARLQETIVILDRLLGQVRQISLNLRPSMLDDLGLVPALRSLLDEQGRRASVTARLTADDMPENLSPEIQTTCFRIAQEAITNAMRHADATQIDVDLRCEVGNLRLLIRDNGAGFHVESVRAQTIGLGLIGITERAALIGGRARIISSPGKGTTIEVVLPLTLRHE